MRSRNGAAFSFRYQYLTGGVNTSNGWEHWQQPSGQFATSYMQESAQHGYMPAFVYYEICLSNGPHPSSYCGSHNIDQDTGNLADASTMNAYFANWVLMLQKIGAFGKPVFVVVEPDLWGFLQNATHGSNNAATIPATLMRQAIPTMRKDLHGHYCICVINMLATLLWRCMPQPGPRVMISPRIPIKMWM
jgi:hypothetical protein